MATYKISKKAKRDLIKIWEYTLRRWSIVQADKYYNLLLSEMQEIANTPLSGKNYHSTRQNYLGYKVKSHIIFYRIQDSEEIEIMRILHSRMDLASRLK